jgi:class 3 adenylate cyclase
MHKVLRKLLYALALASVVTALAAAGLTTGAFGGFVRRSSDSLFPSADTDPRIVVVGVDGKTINLVGQVPLPRAVQAKLAQQLAASGASVVVWDFVFAGSKPGDDELASAMAELPAAVIGASYLTRPGQGYYDVVKVDLAPPTQLATAGNAGGETHTVVGHVNVINDPADGVVRSVPLIYRNGDNFEYALSLQALAAFRHTLPTVKRDGSIQVGSTIIPTEGRELLRLNFANGLDSRSARAVVSAADVLTGKADPSRFRGKIVFIGATAPILGDKLLAAVDKSNTFPGVLIHANAVNTMLTASYLTPSSDAESTLWCGLLALIVALAALFLPIWASLLIALVLLGIPPLVPGAYLLIAYTRFDHGHVMNIVYPLAVVVLTFFGGLAVRYLTETRQRRRVSSLFAQYVPETVAKQLEESGALASHVEGERVDVGLFFCDLRGFTSLSATLEPHEVRAMLNHFYDLLTEIIHTYGGTVLKFVGDEVFAVFGAPLPCENNAQATLDCAVEIQRQAPELDQELADLGIPPVKFGIGMNAGDVVAAHIGGGRRRQYDIVGDTVNLGSRLCGQAGKGEIVLPESMIHRFTTVPPMESMGAVQLKGLEQPVPLFKVTVGDSEPRQAAPAAAPARS